MKYNGTTLRNPKDIVEASHFEDIFSGKPNDLFDCDFQQEILKNVKILNLLLIEKMTHILAMTLQLKM